MEPLNVFFDFGRRLHVERHETDRRILGFVKKVTC